ncbi:hypothetical protein CC117_21870 [Parafrankia colletiae]|uniref:DUF4367 domain-containing protein n=1 Tax=Parafrankia colletiae TaxID=573497 RepID=A0A1S1QKR5_9ACTN|nr:hypothetical protein [Parafrankia colletiae]MCK9899919.1 hypothetical protein [Frankia sp. Cpl3]OHV34277.1 hypothetical protein CC117_21870 [Parafrankia colletiae]
MGHTSDGVLRRLLDEPAGVADADREHTASCPRCLAALATMREDAAVVHAALAAAGSIAGTIAAPVDEDAAWHRLVAAAPAASAAATGRPAARSPRRRRVGQFARRPIVAALAASVVIAGAGTAAANGWLQIFQTERVAVIGLRASDLVALPDLSAYGELEWSQQPALREVDDAAAAAEQTGLDVPDVEHLPRGVDGQSLIQVSDEAEAVFTFSTQRAAQAAAAEGRPLPPVPPGLDGSRVRLTAGPGVAQMWPSTSGAPALIVGHAVAPRAFSSGVPFGTVRDYVLSLPGLPDEVAAQLRTYAADGTTLPLPVPSDEFTTKPVDVDGTPATALASRDGTFAAVVWVNGGELFAVAGSLSTDEVLTTARELR